MFVMLTARGCGHCEYFRGNGELGNGKQFMEKKYLLTILDKNLKIYNIHYSSMAGLNSDIISISKTEKINNNIEQNIFYNNNNTLYHKKLVLNSKLNTEFVQNKKMIWNEFVQKKVPVNLQGYTYYFPCFGMFKIDNWEKSISNSESLMGILNLGYTVVDNAGSVFLYKDSKFLEKRKLSNDQLINNVLNGKIKFKPVKIKDLLNNNFETTDIKENEENSKEKMNIEKEKMIIIQY